MGDDGDGGEHGGVEGERPHHLARRDHDGHDEGERGDELALRGEAVDAGLAVDEEAVGVVGLHRCTRRMIQTAVTPMTKHSATPISPARPVESPAPSTPDTE